jgi:hypothetical protein
VVERASHRDRGEDTPVEDVQQKKLEVILAEALTQKGAVMVHALHAGPAGGTVVRSEDLPVLALLALPNPREQLL